MARMQEWLRQTIRWIWGFFLAGLILSLVASYLYSAGNNGWQFARDHWLWMLLAALVVIAVTAWALMSGRQESFELSVDQNHPIRSRKLLGEGNFLYDFVITLDNVGVDGAKILLRTTRYAAGQKPQVLAAEGYGLGLGQSINLVGVPWRLKLKAVREQKRSATLILEKLAE